MRRLFAEKHAAVKRRCVEALGKRAAAAYDLNMRRDSFERFYYEKIALAEGCGCAEHVTRMRDNDALACGQRAATPRFASIAAVRKAATAAFARLRDRLAYRPGLRSSRI